MKFEPRRKAHWILELSWVNSLHGLRNEMETRSILAEKKTEICKLFDGPQIKNCRRGHNSDPERGPLDEYRFGYEFNCYFGANDPWECLALRYVCFLRLPLRLLAIKNTFAKRGIHGELRRKKTF